MGETIHPFSGAGLVVGSSQDGLPVRPHIGASNICSVCVPSVCPPGSELSGLPPHGASPGGELSGLLPLCPFSDGSPDQPDGEEDTEEEGEEDFAKKAVPVPVGPTPEQRDQHRTAGHAVFRAWCGPCQKGRGRSVGHQRKERGPDETPVLSWDYGFLGQKEGQSESDASGQSPVLCMRDRSSHCVAWYLLPRKGCDYETFSNFLTMAVIDLERLGYRRVIFRSDGERALVAVLNRLRDAWSGEVIEEHSAEGDSSSNGSAECGVGLMKGHVRTVKADLEELIQAEIPEDHNLLT